MKKIMIGMLICFMATALYAHCGGCGTEVEKIEVKKTCCELPKTKTKTTNLSKKDREAVEKVIKDYQAELAKLNKKYKEKIKKSVHSTKDLELTVDVDIKVELKEVAKK